MTTDKEYEPPSFRRLATCSASILMLAVIANIVDAKWLAPIIMMCIPIYMYATRVKPKRKEDRHDR